MLTGAPVACLVADPPWAFGDKLPGPKRGAAKHYACMSVPELCAFEVPTLADDALLFLWRVAAMTGEALEVCKAWGFTPKAELVWLKKTKTGKRWFGMGRYVRAEHETCIVAARGRASRLIVDKGIRSTFEAPAREHSAKPDEFYRIVDQLVGPEAVKCELFARRTCPGWTQFGNELGKLDAPPKQARSPRLVRRMGDYCPSVGD